MGSDLNHVCELHSERAACPDAMIAPIRGGFGLYVRSGKRGYGSSVIGITYCPWCGTKLPPIGDIDLSQLADDER